MSKEIEYIVISPFRDLQDYSKQFPNGKQYAIGDVYSKEERIEQLSTNNNRLNRPLIKAMEVEEENNLEDLTVKELMEIAKDKDIENYSTMKKEELIEAIEGE